MEAYIAFCAFLVPFQTSEPMIHLLHPALCNLLYTLQRKFIRKKKLSSDLSENIYIDVNNKKNVKHSFIQGTNSPQANACARILDCPPGKFNLDCLVYSLYPPKQT